MIDVLRIQRGVKKGNQSEGHTGPIIALYNVNPKILTQYKNNEPTRLISVSLDKTIRIWDPKDLTSIGLLTNDENEISCLLYLPITNLFATGHDTGMIKLWNIETHHSIIIQ